MRRRVHLNEIKVSRNVTLIESGYSRRRRAEIMNASRAAINQAWNWYLKKPYPHRQKATTAREDRLLGLWTVQERTNTHKPFKIS